MPEIDFFFVDNEMEALMDYALGLGFQFTPAIHYVTVPPPQFTERADILQYSPDHPLWHLTRSDYADLPFSMKRLDGGRDVGKYYIVQREGGPMIDLSWSGIRSKDNLPFVCWGNLSHYATFWFPETSEFKRVPDSLRVAFNQLATFIRAHSVASDNPVSEKTGKPWRSVRIGKEAARQWANGLRLGTEPYLRKPKMMPS
ncbi:MAG: hypothetical protein HZA51_10840 [Planctomycetes bacterium]|nr:hypothetical protein [Planctomycetota bacterium]